MKNTTNEIDEMIKEALSQEEASYYENLHEQGLFEMIGELFRGKQRWFMITNVIVSMIFNALGVYCLIYFLKVEDTNELIRWGAGMFGCVIMSSMLKLYSWNQLDKNAILREIKRLQLLVASKA